MSDYFDRTRNFNLPLGEWEKVLKLEQRFLPTKKTIRKFIEKAPCVSTLSEAEALIESEYLTKICLHHQKWYYRLSHSVIDDYLYDQLEKRINALMVVYPHLFPSSHPMHQVGY